MQAGVENREVAEVLGDILRCELLLAGNGEADCLSFFLLNLSFETYLFEIQNNVYYTLNDSGDSVKLMTEDVMANPSNEDNRTLRRALPIVIPYPGSSGRNSNFPKVSVDSSIITLSGF